MTPFFHFWISVFHHLSFPGSNLFLAGLLSFMLPGLQELHLGVYWQNSKRRRQYETSSQHQYRFVQT
jgi:hypothetical protein